MSGGWWLWVDSLLGVRLSDLFMQVLGNLLMLLALLLSAAQHMLISLCHFALCTRPLPRQVVWGEAFDGEAQARKKAEAAEARRAAEKDAYERREA